MSRDFVVLMLYPIHDDELLKELADMIALNDRDAVFSFAKRMIGQGASPLKTPVPQLVSVDEIASRFDLCTRSIWRLVDAGELPQPIHVGHARRWYASDIENYLKLLTEKRDGIQRRRN
jgi:predicted DNA-binding transcriptional regulator AlpA